MACGPVADSPRDPSNVREYVWRGGTESSAPGESTRCVLHCSTERFPAVRGAGAETQRSLVLPDFNRIRLDVFACLGGLSRFREHPRGSYVLGHSFLSPPLLRSVCRFFYKAALLKNVGEQGVFAEIDLSSLAQSFARLQQFP